MVIRTPFSIRLYESRPGMMFAMFQSILFLAFYGRPVFGSAAARDYACVNTAESRDCWKDGFNIETDYYGKEEAPEGKLVEESTVKNNFTENYNGTAVHWHGIRQKETNWLDGVPGVTQCPITPGDSQVYEFRVTQYGTSWYHSHYSLQLMELMLMQSQGPIVIHGPSSANWDVDLGPWLLSDWYHDDAFALDHVGITTNRAAIPKSSLINGKGYYECDPTNDAKCTGTRDYYEVVLKQGTKYKFGIINTSTILTYTFWIDGHNFTIIAIDFVPIEPLTVDTLNVGIGQRYEIIIETNPDFDDDSSFWMHAQYCFINQTDIVDDKVGIVRYESAGSSDPPYINKSDYHLNFGCADPKPESLVPILKQQVGAQANPLAAEDYFRVGLGNFTWPDATNSTGSVFLWFLQKLPLYVNWSEPSVKKLTIDETADFPPNSRPIELDYETGQWVYFVIESDWDPAGAVDQYGQEIRVEPSVHPFHLHGHDFLILAQGLGKFTSDIQPNLDNPPRRDTVDVEPLGYVWIAFQIDNPGAWLFHCHIAFHSSDGIAIQFLEQPSKLKPIMEEAGVLGDFADRCNKWDDWYQAVNIPHNATQADSGV
nr:PtaE [Pestalotiopsis fici]